MMKSSSVNKSPLISGIINFLSSSILKAEELSTTRQPIAANFGAHSNEIPPPAEKRATSGFISKAFSKSTTVWSCPPKVIFEPAEFFDATGINSVIGRLISANTFNISCPTIPVTPTIASFIFSVFTNVINFGFGWLDFGFGGKCSFGAKLYVNRYKKQNKLLIICFYVYFKVGFLAFKF